MSRTRTAACLLITLALVGCGSPGATSSPSAGSPTPSVAPSASIPTPAPTGPAPSATPSESPTPAPTPSVEPSGTPTAAPTPTPSPTPVATMIVRAYFLMASPSGDDPTLVPVLRTVPASSAKLRAAFGTLIGGPTASERDADPRLLTMVPSGTKLLSIKAQAGVATVDLSDEFLSGTDTFAIRARLGQVVYTLTQFASVTQVYFLVRGEGINVDPSAWRLADEPIGRGAFRDLLLPAIFVDRPAWGASYLSGSAITGVANVAEAQFLVAIRDAKGSVLDQSPVVASCGTGCWGDFSITLHYDVAKAQWGQLRAWDISEADSSVIALRTYPVYLRP